ncbi:MAG: ABC transporter ATP-binding protein [Gammaproteobacteria bacterium]|nr:ABC transporter ATP-binding protein [Gammaproteobacteria bacterium]
MSQAVIARGVRKEISSRDARLTILDGVDLDVAPGESVAIVGASGSGKTTLLSLLAGLDSPSGGAIRLDGRELTRLDEDARSAWRAGRVGFVFQSFQLLAGLTALENVMLPAELAGLSDAAARARRALDQVGLTPRLAHYPYQLSGGEQQRVAIARAFAGEPRILFADEPTGNLDTATGAHIIDLLFDLNRERGTTLVLVTHDADLARRCDRVLTLRDGRLHE